MERKKLESFFVFDDLSVSPNTFWRIGIPIEMNKLVFISEEAVFAIAGLLAVAYLFLRRGKK